VAVVVGLVFGTFALALLFHQQSQIGRRQHISSGSGPKEIRGKSGGSSNGETRSPAPLALAALPDRSKPAVVSDQNTLGYDAVNLIAATDISVVAVFEAETRDPVWAPKREKAVEAIIARDLESTNSKATLKNIECKHSTCKMVFEGASLDDANQGAVLIQYATLGSYTEPARAEQADGRVNVSVFVAFDSEERKDEFWRDYYAEKRKMGLARWRNIRPPEKWYPSVPQD
jgi:hypothetical protein